MFAFCPFRLQVLWLSSARLSALVCKFYGFWHEKQRKGNPPHSNYGIKQNNNIMKKKSLISLCCMGLSVAVLGSCVGSFSLFNKFASWNKRATGCKFLNELLFIVLSPVYVVCGVADVLVLNTIEFWSGSNPISAKEIGKTKNVLAKNGEMFSVKTLENGYDVRDSKGKLYHFEYNKTGDSWSLETEGKTRELFRFNQDGTIEAQLPDGGSIALTQDAQGLYEARMAVNGGTFFAWK